jgi:hypothetical protein
VRWYPAIEMWKRFMGVNLFVWYPLTMPWVAGDVKKKVSPVVRDVCWGVYVGVGVCTRCARWRGGRVGYRGKALFFYIDGVWKFPTKLFPVSPHKRPA